MLFSITPTTTLAKTFFFFFFLFYSANASLQYADHIMSLNPEWYFRLGETSGTSMINEVNSSLATGTRIVNVGSGSTTGAIGDDPNLAYNLLPALSADQLRL